MKIKKSVTVKKSVQWHDISSQIQISKNFCFCLCCHVSVFFSFFFFIFFFCIMVVNSSVLHKKKLTVYSYLLKCQLAKEIFFYIKWTRLYRMGCTHQWFFIKNKQPLDVAQVYLQHKLQLLISSLENWYCHMIFQVKYKIWRHFFLHLFLLSCVSICCCCIMAVNSTVSWEYDMVLYSLKICYQYGKFCKN